MKNLHITPGFPLPLGTTVTPRGINFAIFSRHATAVTLVITEKTGLLQEIPLDPQLNKTGDIWHIHLTGVSTDLRYGYRMDGPHIPHQGHHYDPALVLLDPYARQLEANPWGQDKICLQRSPCCRVFTRNYDWQGDRPLKTPLQDTIIYEMHIRGFSRHPSSGVTAPGTFKGVMEKIDYLKHLGISAVELMPVTEFNENEPLFRNPFTGERLKNFWGYSPLSFFALKSSYASDIHHPLDEFRDMVRALHKAGIEVILDMVYNHTAEGGADGPTTSFLGIDNIIYYLLDPWTRAYLNFSGCGNTMNCNHPVVRTLIMDALRWWVVEMHVDGFRFDLAAILGRDQRGQVLANPPVVEMIAEDPVLADCKIIAEAWDAAGLYQVGSFSDHQRWAEWNGRFRDDVRAFMCGYPGMVPALATRIAGSSDLYQDNGRKPYNSINFITSHDGFTLADLVSYDHKHNLINGEDNRDGDNNNISWNSGVEGDTNDAAILTLRSRRIRTMAVILLVSQGVPMLVAGDEFGRSQQGNNNAWCQDNAISWINWELARNNSLQLRFFRRLIQLRRAHPVFRRHDFFLNHPPTDRRPCRDEIIWQGLRPGEQDWSYHCHTLGFTLCGGALPEGPDDDFFIMLNGHRQQERTFTIPPVPPRRNPRIWKKIIDTGLEGPADFLDSAQAPPLEENSRVAVAPMGCVVLQSRHN